jgi:hypothetical protein
MSSLLCAFHKEFINSGANKIRGIRNPFECRFGPNDLTEWNEWVSEW